MGDFICSLICSSVFNLKFTKFGHFRTIPNFSKCLFTSISSWKGHEIKTIISENCGLEKVCGRTCSFEIQKGRCKILQERFPSNITRFHRRLKWSDPMVSIYEGKTLVSSKSTKQQIHRREWICWMHFRWKFEDLVVIYDNDNYIFQNRRDLVFIAVLKRY